MCSITAIILTYQEEKHIERCILSLLDFVDKIVVVDSFSSDNTVQLAKSLGADVFQNEWINYSNQFNWSLENLNNLTWWTDKHNHYASREVIDTFDTKFNILGVSQIRPIFFGTDEQRKRYLKLKYLSLPLFLRPFIYFFYRYIIKLGFMDGKSGFVWHILQSFWYRMLVDSKIYELKKKFKRDNNLIVKSLKENYNIE